MTDARLIEDAQAAPLLTERLRLRPLSGEDWPHWPSFYASDRSRFVGGPMQLSNAWFKFAQLVGVSAMRGFGHWSVETRDGGEYLGRVGLEHADGWAYLELGWTFLEGASGRGYATEAATTLRTHAFAKILPFVPTADGICSLIHPDNAPSRRVAERLGAAQDFEATPVWPDHQVWRHPTPGAVAAEAAA